MNLKIHPVIGIPPSANLSTKIFEEAMVYLEEFVKDKKVLGIGQIGIGSGSRDEYLILKEQLALAGKYNLPVIVEVPTRDSVALTSIILKELTKAKVAQAIINNCDAEILQLVVRTHNLNYKAGITVGQQATSPEEALQIFKNYSYADRILFNTSLGIKDSSLFGLSNTIELFEQAQVNEEFLEKMCYSNYLDVFPTLTKSMKSLI